MYLLDSDYLISFLNGDKKTIDVIDKIKDTRLSTSIICVAEVLEGLLLIGQEKKTEQFQEFVSNMEVFLIDAHVAFEFAKLRSGMRKKGQLIDNFDLLIGATCMAYDLTLITGNLSHFERIKGLRIFR